MGVRDHRHVTRGGGHTAGEINLLGHGHERLDGSQRRGAREAAEIDPVEAERHHRSRRERVIDARSHDLSSALQRLT